MYKEDKISNATKNDLMIKYKRKRILVIEDEEDITAYLTAVFEDNGYEVDSAVDGVQAMSKIRENKPDLISLDVSIPEKTGVKIYCELKADPHLASIPVVMVTGIEREFQKYISTRKDLPPPEGYIAKPFQADELLHTISNLLNGNK